MEISYEKKKIEMEMQIDVESEMEIDGSSEKRMEIDGKFSSSGEKEIDGKSCSSMDTDSTKTDSSVKSMDCSYFTPETQTKTRAPMEGSYAVGSKTDSSIASSPSVTSPVAATSSLTPKKKKKSQLSCEFNDDGEKIYTLRCGCGDSQRLTASYSNIFLV